MDIVINLLNPYFKKIKKYGLKSSIEKFLPSGEVHGFIISKIKKQLANKKGLKLGGFFGRADVQYKENGIQIEFYGFARGIVKTIIITDKQISEYIDDIIIQIEKKYLENSKFIECKLGSILINISEICIYKPQTSEEKTFNDLFEILLLNFHESAKNHPDWVNLVLKKIEKGEYIDSFLGLIVETFCTIISNITENVYFNFKVSFDSIFLRTVLNMKTNKGQISKFFSIFNININNMICEFVEDYTSPSFMNSVGEMLSSVISAVLDEKKLDHNTFDVNSGLNNKYPNKITMTLGENSESERCFRWFGDKTCTEAVIEYSDNENFSNREQIKATHEQIQVAIPTFSIGVISSYKISYTSQFSAKITNLKPNVNYYYKIINYSKSLEFSSQIYNFCVKSADEPSRFVIFSDSQGMVKNDYEMFNKVFEQALNLTKKTVDFAIHLGDFVDDGNNENYWRWLLDSKVWANTAVMPLPGNHEAKYNAATYKSCVKNAIINHFNLDDLHKIHQDTTKGAYYSRVYKNITFIVLNTNNTNSEKYLTKEQYSWALNISKNAKTKWKILLVHKSPYSNGPHYGDKDVQNIGKQIIDLAYETDVDLCFGGHDHVYCRTPVLSNGRTISGDIKTTCHMGVSYQTYVNPGGTVFIVPGTSGVKNYRQTLCFDHPLEKMIDADYPIFSTLDVNNNTMFFTAYRYDETTKTSQIIDKIAIEKSNENDDANCYELCRKINNISTFPWVNSKKKINKIKEIYEGLGYFLKLKVYNYNTLLNIEKNTEKYKAIFKRQIVFVNNKHEFLSAVYKLNNNENKIGTIVINCGEIKFENSFGLGSKVVIENDLCISGNAKLLYVKFVVKNGAMLILCKNICIDNTRRLFSFYKSLTAIELKDNTTLVVNGRVSINSGYGIGCAPAFDVVGSNTQVYLNSTNENFAKKEFLSSKQLSSTVIINNGKYKNMSNSINFKIRGKFYLNSGEIEGLKLYENSKFKANGGVIGSKKGNKYGLLARVLKKNTPIINKGIMQIYCCKINSKKIDSKKDFENNKVKAPLIFSIGESAKVFLMPRHDGAISLGGRSLILGEITQKSGNLRVTLSKQFLKNGQNNINIISANNNLKFEEMLKRSKIILKNIKNNIVINLNDLRGLNNFKNVRLFLCFKTNQDQRFEKNIVLKDGAELCILSNPCCLEQNSE